MTLKKSQDIMMKKIILLCMLFTTIFSSICFSDKYEKYEEEFEGLTSAQLLAMIKDPECEETKKIAIVKKLNYSDLLSQTLVSFLTLVAEHSNDDQNKAYSLCFLERIHRDNALLKEQAIYKLWQIVDNSPDQMAVIISAQNLRELEKKDSPNYKKAEDALVRIAKSSANDEMRLNAMIKLNFLVFSSHHGLQEVFIEPCYELSQQTKNDRIKAEAIQLLSNGSNSYSTHFEGLINQLMKIARLSEDHEARLVALSTLWRHHPSRVEIFDELIELIKMVVPLTKNTISKCYLLESLFQNEKVEENDRTYFLTCLIKIAKTRPYKSFLFVVWKNTIAKKLFYNELVEALVTTSRFPAHSTQTSAIQCLFQDSDLKASYYEEFVNLLLTQFRESVSEECSEDALLGLWAIDEARNQHLKELTDALLKRLRNTNSDMHKDSLLSWLWKYPDIRNKHSAELFPLKMESTHRIQEISRRLWELKLLSNDPEFKAKFGQELKSMLMDIVRTAKSSTDKKEAADSLFYDSTLDELTRQELAKFYKGLTQE